VTFVIQAEARQPEIDRFLAAVSWLQASVAHPDGFLGLRVLRSTDGQRVSMFEEWRSAEDFQRSFNEYAASHRGEFLSRAGIDPDQFTVDQWNVVWSSSDAVSVESTIPAP
jgi:quinol monooxygenase YgiN